MLYGILKQVQLNEKVVITIDIQFSNYYIKKEPTTTSKLRIQLLKL